MQKILITLLLGCIAAISQAQTPTTFFWGAKGGFTLANQKWNASQSRVLPTYHAATFVEFMGPWNNGKNETGIQKRFGFMTSLGYHRRGRAITFRSGGNSFSASDVFHNVSLLFAGKGYFQLNKQWAAYYGLGLRIDYTAAWRLELASVWHDPYVNRINYGVWLGGGIEFQLAKTSAFLELSISPDASRQVFMPPGIFLNFTDAFGNQLQTREERVYNFALEISLGFKIGRNEPEPVLID